MIASGGPGARKQASLFGPFLAVGGIIGLCTAFALNRRGVAVTVIEAQPRVLMRGVPEDQMAREAQALCAETIQQLREIPGIRGVHIIASGDDDFIPEVLTRAGVPRRGYGDLANSAEPWPIPDPSTLERTPIDLATDPERFRPYGRDPETLARPWAIPGTPGLEHRIGGIEKADVTGDVSYDPANHEHMVRLRAEKVARIASSIPPVEVLGDVDDAEVLVVGWGSTWGAIDGAVSRARRAGHRVAHVHLVHLNPFPPNLGEVLARYPRVMVPEMNLGQLAHQLRAEFLVDARPVTKVRGVPFTASELEQAIVDRLKDA